MVVDITDVITYANLGEDWLRSLGVAGVKVCPSPLTLIVALTSLALPCECVIRRLDLKGNQSSVFSSEQFNANITMRANTAFGP